MIWDSRERPVVLHAGHSRAISVDGPALRCICDQVLIMRGAFMLKMLLDCHEMLDKMLTVADEDDIADVSVMSRRS